MDEIERVNLWYKEQYKYIDIYPNNMPTLEQLEKWKQTISSEIETEYRENILDYKNIIISGNRRWKRYETLYKVYMKFWRDIYIFQTQQQIRRHMLYEEYMTQLKEIEYNWRFKECSNMIKYDGNL